MVGGAIWTRAAALSEGKTQVGVKFYRGEPVFASQGWGEGGDRHFRRKGVAIDLSAGAPRPVQGAPRVDRGRGQVPPSPPGSAYARVYAVLECST